NRALFVGAPRSDSFGTDAGAIYQIDLGVVGVRFSKQEYVAEEGSWRGLHETEPYLDGWKVAITVIRDDGAEASDWLTVAFATSDLTARGVDSVAYQLCWELPVRGRDSAVCGDYEQTAGELTFAPGETTSSFFVRVMDDHCPEHYPEYVQLSLSIPGGAALRGETYLAKLRIDDDDKGREQCSSS
ncbi:unnamed protein product, partial [Discosporangium mesarthrocarpum]